MLSESCLKPSDLSLPLSVLDLVHPQSMCQDPSPPSPDASGTGSMLSFRQDGNVFESHRSAGRIALEFAMKLLACLTSGTDLVNFPERVTRIATKYHTVSSMPGAWSKPTYASGITTARTS